jgi:hypothetical protein
LTVLLFAGSAFAQAGKRSGVGPCRQGALALIAMLDGTGIHVDDLLGLLADSKLLTVKRGRAGGIYYPKGVS